MSTKVINISLAGRIQDQGKTLRGVELHYQDHCLALNLKNGQSYQEDYHGQSTLADTSLLLAVSESRLARRASESLRQLPTTVLAEWLIKVARRLPPHERLIRAIEEVNYQIWRAAQEDAESQILATSLAAVNIEQNIAYIAQVGTAEVFIVRQGR